MLRSFSLAPVASDPNACGCAPGDSVIRDFLFTLPTPVILGPGTYWLIAGPFAHGPDFVWQTRHPIVGAVPRYTFDLGSSWRESAGGDRAFALFGTSAPQQAQTITFPAITPNPASVGGTAALGAAASSGLAVSYISLTEGVCTVDGNTLSFIAVGTCTVAADQADNAAYSPAPRAMQGVTVNKATQAITFTSVPPASPTALGTYTVTATGGASGNSVTFGTSTPNVCTLAGSTVSFVIGGSCTVTADRAGNASYLAAPQVTQTFTVNKAAQAIAWTSTPPSPAYLNATYGGRRRRGVGKRGGPYGRPT